MQVSCRGKPSPNNKGLIKKNKLSLVQKVLATLTIDTSAISVHNFPSFHMFQLLVFSPSFYEILEQNHDS